MWPRFHSFLSISVHFLPIAVSTYFSLRSNKLHFYPIDGVSHPPRCRTMTCNDSCSLSPLVVAGWDMVLSSVHGHRR
jgi:hypothetical protein